MKPSKLSFFTLLGKMYHAVPVGSYSLGCGTYLLRILIRLHEGHSLVWSYKKSCITRYMILSAVSSAHSAVMLSSNQFSASSACGLTGLYFSNCCTWLCLLQHDLSTPWHMFQGAEPKNSLLINTTLSLAWCDEKPFSHSHILHRSTRHIC